MQVGGEGGDAMSDWRVDAVMLLALWHCRRCEWEGRLTNSIVPHMRDVAPVAPPATSIPHGPRHGF
eukprot:3918207-Prorocentrum_lima.AAC.1